MAHQRFKLKHTRCVLVLAGVVGIPALSHAQTAPTPQQTQEQIQEQIQQQQEQQSKDRAKAIQDQQPAAPDVRLTPPATE